MVTKISSSSPAHYRSMSFRITRFDSFFFCCSTTTRVVCWRNVPLIYSSFGKFSSDAARWTHRQSRSITDLVNVNRFDSDRGGIIGMLVISHSWGSSWGSSLGSASIEYMVGVHHTRGERGQTTSDPMPRIARSRQAGGSGTIRHFASLFPRKCSFQELDLYLYCFKNLFYQFSLLPLSAAFVRVRRGAQKASD